jgi:glycine cleavage system H protein
MSWNTPSDLKYMRSDEYLKLEGTTATIGISDYAQEQLNDIVFVELPDVGVELAKGKPFGTVESVKAQSDLNMPVSGKIIAVNDKLKDQPELLNSAPYGDGWIIKIEVKDAAEAGDLMDAAAYAAYCASR